MNKAIWKEKLLEAVAGLGGEGRAASDFLRRRKTFIGFWRVRKNVGAFWTFLGTIHFNSFYYSMNSDMTDVSLLTLLIHEVKHLQQGVILAFSVYGELEEWQMQFRLYHQLTGTQPRPEIIELLALPLKLDREILKKAVHLMQVYAGKGYRADLMPLYPFHHEIRYCFLRK